MMTFTLIKKCIPQLNWP